jgi:hypothetical protein
MTTTYQMIKSLPAKGFDWNGFLSALRAEYVELCAQNRRVTLCLGEWDTMISGGMADRRRAAMELAGWLVDFKAKRQKIIPPSDESRMWDSFEGGHNLVWTDRDAEETATSEISRLIERLQ